MYQQSEWILVRKTWEMRDSVHSEEVTKQEKLKMFLHWPLPRRKFL